MRYQTSLRYTIKGRYDIRIYDDELLIIYELTTNEFISIHYDKTCFFEFQEAKQI